MTENGTFSSLNNFSPLPMLMPSASCLRACFLPDKFITVSTELQSN